MFGPLSYKWFSSYFLNPFAWVSSGFDYIFSFVKDPVWIYPPESVGKKEEDATGLVNVTIMKSRLERVTISGWNVAEIKAKKKHQHKCCKIMNQNIWSNAIFQFSFNASSCSAVQWWSRTVIWTVYESFIPILLENYSWSLLKKIV